MSKRILLVDDHAIVRAGFHFLLKSSTDYDICEATSAEQAFEMLTDFEPDIVIMDLIMPGLGGMGGIRRMLAKNSKIRILVLSMHDDLTYVARVIQMGVMGYVTKRSAPNELISAIEALLQGNVYFSSDIEDAVTDFDDVTPVNDRVQSLTEREFEVFCMLSEGRTVVEISKDLCLSPKTVSNHRQNIMEKLGAKNIVQLVRIAIRQGLIQV